MFIWTKSAVLLSVFFVSIAGFAGQQIKSGEYKSSVVELYTSEGCSSCPPADEFLSRLGKTEEADQIIPLAFHVDYWDYIGWKDPYARAGYTERQRVVARANSQQSIYTPEFVVDGAEARGGSKIAGKVSATHQSLTEADITLYLADVDDGKLMARVSIENLTYTGSDTPEVYLAVYENNLSSSVDAGENRGRSLKHDYVVRYISPPEQTLSGQRHQFSVPLEAGWNHSALGVAAVVKLQQSGRTLQAVKGML